MSFIPRDMLQRLIDSQLLQNFARGTANTVPFQLDMISKQLSEMNNITAHNTPHVSNHIHQPPYNPGAEMPSIPSIPTIPTIDIPPIPTYDHYNY